jgi:hypothetical protein
MIPRGVALIYPECKKNIKETRCFAMARYWILLGW